VYIAHIEVIVALQSARTQFQSLAQLPAVGPLEVPGMQVLLAPQKPQPARPVQSSHPVAPSQSVGTEHSRGIHAQSAQLPSSGPMSAPGWQRPVSPHQPHGSCMVHWSHAE
jgi:hypothetical protein